MQKPSAKYVLLTGSNLGNREQLLEDALQAIEDSIGSIVKTSSIHQTEPWGFESEHMFLNQAVLVETELDPYQVLNKIHEIESGLGRTRERKQWVSRVIDIDILCSDQKPLNTDVLTIPHPRLHERGFALAPLCELVPNWIHELTGKNYQALLEEVDNQQLIQAE